MVSSATQHKHSYIRAKKLAQQKKTKVKNRVT